MSVLISTNYSNKQSESKDNLKPPRMPKAISSCAASRRRRAKSSLKSLESSWLILIDIRSPCHNHFHSHCAFLIHLAPILKTLPRYSKSSPCCAVMRNTELSALCVPHKVPSDNYGSPTCCNFDGFYLLPTSCGETKLPSFHLIPSPFPVPGVIFIQTDRGGELRKLRQ